jgi:hypothetical protein
MRIVNCLDNAIYAMRTAPVVVSKQSDHRLSEVDPTLVHLLARSLRLRSI